MENLLVFVDGELYKGNITYVKGCDWEAGRTVGLILDKKLGDSSKKVSLVNLFFETLRHCEYNKDHQKFLSIKESQIYWDVLKGF